jgi:thioredoxin reductase (NADPH)
LADQEPKLDLAVVGAGPCGLAVGAAARRRGLSVVLFDRGPLCASLVDYPPYMSFFSTAEKLEIEGLPFTSIRPNPTRQEALGYYRGVARYFALDVRQYHEVEEVTPGPSGFELVTRRRDSPAAAFQARSVVVATGGFHAPNLLGVPGEDLAKVSHYYREPHPFWNQDVVVVGGGNSAVEAALELFRTGARVTLVHFARELDSGVKPWLLPDIRNRFAQGEIRVLWGHRVVEVLHDRVRLRSEDDGRSLDLPNDLVLALTGWTPDPTLLRSLGVPIEAGSGVPGHDPVTMETPVTGLFVAGVITAGKDANRIFIENGRMHGSRIVDHLLERSRRS